MRTKKIRIRQGFTIVELVIVIGVIGVLSAVLIPTFITLNNKAEMASQQSFLKNVNTQIAMRDADKHDVVTMHDAVEVAADMGFDVEKISPIDGNDIVYDFTAKRFGLMRDNQITFKDGGFETLGVNVWKIAASSEDINAINTAGYSIYAKDGWNLGDVGTIKVGFDAGRNITATSVTYSHTGAEQSVVIRTNGGKLTIQAPEDTVKHYGTASEVEVKEVASSSYHLYGEVTVKLTVSDGRAVVEKGGSVGSLEVAKGAEEVVISEGSSVDNLSVASDADIASEKLQVEAGAEVDVLVNNSSTVDTSAIADAGTKVVNTTGYAENVVMVKIDNNQTFTSANSLSSNGNYILVKDVTASVTPGTFAKNVSLDLNGHTVTNTLSTRHVINNCRKGGFFDVKGVGRLVQANGESNTAAVYTVTDINVGPGVSLEGAAVGLWAEQTKAPFVVNFAGSIKSTLAGSFGFYRNGTNKDTVNCPTINIAETAKVDVADGAAIYGAGYAVWNIEGGEFKSKECLEFKSGIIKINDGRFEATAESTSHVPNGNGTSANGYALAAIWNDGYAKPLTVTLNGGEFVGPVAKLTDSSDASTIDSIVFNNNIGIHLA